MPNLRQLTPQDVLFVGGETSTIYQHTAGLILIDSSDRPGFGFEAFRRHEEERIGSIPHFRWKLHEVPLGLDLPYWVEDDHFSFDHHIRRIAVPSPGDREALGELVSYLYCKHLDRNRPLWEAWFIEGLADGQYAVVHKMHHCMMDGEGASKLLEILCDFTPDAAPPEIDRAIAEAQAGQVPELWRQSLYAARRLSALPLQATREIYDAVRHGLWQRMSRSDKPSARPSAPVAPFNADISSDRGFVFGSLPLADIRTVKSHFGVTVNDVVLALVSSSLRNYLLLQDQLPDESLRTFIAVSLRTDEDDRFSNKVTSKAVTLATALQDPLERLHAIAGETDLVKKQARGGGKGFMEIMQILPPLLVNVIAHMTPGDQVASIMGANLMVSSIRGSAKPMYMGGARMCSVYPMSIINPGSGINVTCISYADNFDFGVTIDPEMFPNPWRIIDGLHEALGEYLALVGKRAGRRKVNGAGSPAQQTEEVRHGQAESRAETLDSRKGEGCDESSHRQKEPGDGRQTIIAGTAFTAPLRWFSCSRP